MHVALIAGTNSDCAEDVVASIQRQLGDLGSRVRVFSCNPAKGEVPSYISQSAVLHERGGNPLSLIFTSRLNHVKNEAS